jgi:hypothetical protein
VFAGQPSGDGDGNGDGDSVSNGDNGGNDAHDALCCVMRCQYQACSGGEGGGDRLRAIMRVGAHTDELPGVTVVSQ